MAEIVRRKIMTIYDGLKFEPRNDLEWIVMGVDRDMTTIKIPEAFDGRKVTKINDCAFMNNHLVEAVNIPKFVNSIGKNAFAGCRNMKYLFIETNYEVTTIGERAFYKCDMLTGITCLNPVIIGNEAFAECANLRTADGCFYELHSRAFKNCQMLHMVNLHSGTVIVFDAFMGCNGLNRMRPCI